MGNVFDASCSKCETVLVHLYRRDGQRKISVTCWVCGANVQFDLERALEKLGEPDKLDLGIEGVILAPMPRLRH